MDDGPPLWDTLWAAGQPHGMVAGGYRAIDSLRLEKGYRVWSSDITPDDTPYEAGLGFAVRLNKEPAFIGQEALQAVQRGELDRRLSCLVLDDPLAVAVGNEPIRVGGEVVGRVTSGGYGFSVGASIAYGYLPAAAAKVGRAVEVELFGEWVRRHGQRGAAVRPVRVADQGVARIRSPRTRGRHRGRMPTAARTRGT